MKEELSTFNKLALFIKTFHNGRLASGGKEITKKCHICGDSRDPRSQHMYIGINKDSGVFVYNCFKCNSFGMVTSQFIREMDPYHETSDLCIEIDAWNRAKMKNSKHYNIIQQKGLNRIPYAILKSRKNDDTFYKLKKFNKRLGVNLTLEEAEQLKVVFNLKDFLRNNNISIITRHPNMIEILDKYYIGFLSMDSSFIIFRSLIPESKIPGNIGHRYENYNIFGSIDNTYRHYIIPCEIDTLSMSPIKIFIAEGAFDILSLYLNVIKDHNQCIFSAIGGKSYFMMVKFFIEKYGLINSEFHICPDAEIDNYEMINIQKVLQPFKIPVYVHRNSYPGEKDFGVSKDRIRLSTMKIV